jgi:hypothetical protein
MIASYKHDYPHKFETMVIHVVPMPSRLFFYHVFHIYHGGTRWIHFSHYVVESVHGNVVEGKQRQSPFNFKYVKHLQTNIRYKSSIG